MKNKITCEVQKLYRGKKIEEVLNMISINVWDRIGFARSRKGFKIYETTITQDVLHQLTLASEVSDHGIKLYESKSEKTNGNDIECYIKIHGGFIFFPIQAKLMYANNSYTQIAHQRNGIDQIDLLINYAKKKKGYPLYFLYNGIPSQTRLYESAKESLVIPELYGVSFTSAIHIKEKFQNQYKNSKGELKWHIPSFHELHPEFAKPLRNFDGWFIDQLHASELIENTFKYSPTNYDLTIYSKEQLLNDDSWVDLTPNNGFSSEFSKDSIGEKSYRNIDHQAPSKTSYYQDLEEGFKPKFRLILSNIIEEDNS